MAWRRPGGTPLSEPMMLNLPKLICVSRPQWVNSRGPNDACMYLNRLRDGARSLVQYRFRISRYEGAPIIKTKMTMRSVR